VPGSPKIARMSFSAKDDKALYPLHVLIFRANGVMSHPDTRADFIKQFRRSRCIGRQSRLHIHLGNEERRFDSNGYNRTEINIHLTESAYTPIRVFT